MTPWAELARACWPTNANAEYLRSSSDVELRFPMTSLACGWIVSAESVRLPTCPSQTITSLAPPSRKPCTAALISPVSNCRISASFGSVWSCRHTPATPSASVIMKTRLLCGNKGTTVSKSRIVKRIAGHISARLCAGMPSDTVSTQGVLHVPSLNALSLRPCVTRRTTFRPGISRRSHWNHQGLSRRRYSQRGHRSPQSANQRCRPYRDQRDRLLLPPSPRHRLFPSLPSSPV